jgi:hypothetical protein
MERAVFHLLLLLVVVVVSLLQQHYYPVQQDLLAAVCWCSHIFQELLHLLPLQATEGKWGRGPGVSGKVTGGQHLSYQGREAGSAGGREGRVRGVAGDKGVWLVKHRA